MHVRFSFDTIVLKFWILQLRRRNFGAIHRFLRNFGALHAWLANSFHSDSEASRLSDASIWTVGVTCHDHAVEKNRGNTKPPDEFSFVTNYHSFKKKHWKLPWCCMSLSERLACRQTKSPNGPVSQEFALVRMLAQSTLKTKLLSSTVPDMRVEIAMSVFHKRKKWCRLPSSTCSNFSMRQLEQRIDRLTSYLGDTNKKPV